MHFYLKYIEPNLSKIQKNYYKELELVHLPAWESIMGFQVENLLIKNRNLLIKSLGLTMSSIVDDNPYIQRGTKNIKGCQIDYLIQTNTHTLYACEFKFTKKIIGNEIIADMKEKLSRLIVPQGFAVVPVLIHAGGVTHKLREIKYFYRIIDIADFLV